VAGHRRCVSVYASTNVHEPVPGGQKNIDAPGPRWNRKADLWGSRQRIPVGLSSRGLAVADGLLDGRPVVLIDADRQGAQGNRSRTSPGLWFARPMVTLWKKWRKTAAQRDSWRGLQAMGRSLFAGAASLSQKVLIQTLNRPGDGSGFRYQCALRDAERRTSRNLGMPPDRLLGRAGATHPAPPLMTRCWRRPSSSSWTG